MDQPGKSKSELIIEKFEKAKRHRQKMDPKWKELDAFDRGEQWDLGGQPIPPWVPKPVTNYIHLVKTTKRAALAIENPAAMFMGQTPTDHEKAKEMQRVFDFVWDQMRARSVVRDALETSRLLGTAIAHVYYEDGNGEVKGGEGARYEGEIKCQQIDPANFFPDPNAFRLEDCEYIHLVYRRPIAWVKKQFGISDIEAREMANSEQGEIYNRDYNSEDLSKIIDFHMHFEKEANSKDVGGYTYYETYLAGNKIVRERTKLRPNRYPFAILYDYPQRQDFWGMSTCQVILDNQKLINKVESIIALIGTLMQNPQKVVRKQSGINPADVTKYGSTPGHTWLSNIPVEQAMKWMEMPQIPQTLFNLAEQARLNIREITGLTEAYMGQTVGSLQTSSGVHSLIERSTMRDKDQMYDFEVFIEDLTEIIMSFVTEYYTENRVGRLLKVQDKEPVFFEYIGSDYKEVAYDIKIDVSAKAPVTRLRKQEELDKMLTLQGQMQFDPPLITPQEFIRESEFINGEQFLERMNLDEIQGVNAILQETLQMMIEASENGLPPEEVAAMAESMVTQRMEQRQGGGTGDTSAHAGELQMRQGAPGM